jgi:DNA-binding XRE family transcriptional regulator
LVEQLDQLGEVGKGAGEAVDFMDDHDGDLAGPAVADSSAGWVSLSRERHSTNLVTSRQLRAARTLAGMTQRDLATVLGINERAVRFWERKHDRRPTSAPNDARIEQALLARGVILFAEPTPGARLVDILDSSP